MRLSNETNASNNFFVLLRGYADMSRTVVEECLRYSRTFIKPQYDVVISSPFLILLVAMKHFWLPSSHGKNAEVEKLAFGSQLWLRKE